MGFKHRGIARAKSARQDRRSVKNRLVLPRLGGADRRALLTGTALASTLLIAVIAAPSPAQAVACTQPASPNPIIDTNVNDNITCVNTETRTGGRRAIRLTTTANNGNDIDLNNSGTLTATSGGNRAFGIQTRTRGQFSDTVIVNSGDITSSAGDDAYGIYARATGANSTITINNSGVIEATADDDATGIGAYGHNTGNSVDVDNSGDMTITSVGDDAVGIGVEAFGDGATTNIVNRANIVTMGAVNSIGIESQSVGYGSDIDIDNSGDLTATSTGEYAIGIGAVALDDDSDIGIVNSGDIVATGEDVAFGISANAGDQYNFSYDSAISITNSGALTVSGGLITYGIGVYTLDSGSPIDIVNSGPISATSATANAYGVDAFAGSRDSAISITNSDAITVSAGVDAYGIKAYARGRNNTIDIVNTGDMKVTGQDLAYGIYAYTRSRNSSVSIVNHGDLTVTAGDTAFGIDGSTRGNNSALSIVNHGDLTVTGGFGAPGILASTDGNNSALSIVNSGDLTIESQFVNDGIFATTDGNNSTLSIVNSGAITVTNGGDAYGISARADGPNSAIDIVNSGDLTITGEAYAVGIDVFSFISRVDINNSGNITATSGDYAYGIRVNTFSAPINITNSGSITVTGTGADNAAGIFAVSTGLDADIDIVNSGDISAKGSGDYAAGIAAFSQYGSVGIENTGSIFAEGTAGQVAGIDAYSGTGVTIVNSGTISSSSQLAIIVDGPGAATITNSGTITGFVDLTEQDDTFTNQSGGVFEAKRTSLFGGGDDVFRNASGGTVLALRDGSAAPSFEGLERFENKGLISTVDGATGDNFTISNTVGGTDLDFVASGNSWLAVDASLGGPGSGTDTFTIEGNVSGTTKVTINNTNTVGGEFNPGGIKIVTVTGATPNANAFTLDAPVDAGFFDYDLFFTPTGSGFWSLKSAPGAGAHMLPQLVTAAQDMWHQGSSTWFDRTADLRVLVNGGGAPAENYGAAQNDGIAPTVWVRGSGGWLDRDGSGSTSANGRNYKFDLDRQLDTMDFQMGLDLGSRDLLSQGDALVFGLLGGFVHGDLDYDSINRNFDYDGGQVGAYATYMKGGLFVDTLLNVHIMELDANGALGFPNNDLDATTVGLRSDAGYRFGSFSGGAFLEPLATLEVTWADIDGFALGGNSVKFDDDANVRGRLGLRAGTTMEAWDGTMMEPFVTGSLWGNLSGENQATLTSNGSSFRYEDNIDDVWGELSAGVNFFNFSQTTSVFAKVDVTLGDDVTGLGGKAGMRVAW